MHRGSLVPSEASRSSEVRRVRQPCDRGGTARGGRSPGKSQGLLRECRGKLDQLDEGLAVVADALAMAEASEAHHWDAELERLQGTLTFRRGTARAKAGRGSTPAEIDAEACFRSAIEIA